MRKREIIFILILTLIIVASIGTTLYAWFGILEKTEAIIIHSGKIELEAELYEKGSTEEITESLEYNYFVPGDVYEYELKLTNEGTLNALLYIDFDFSETSEHLKEFVTFEIQGMQISLEDIINETHKYTDPLGLDKKQSKTISFSLIISADLALEDLEEVNKLVLKSITITLNQK